APALRRSSPTRRSSDLVQAGQAAEQARAVGVFGQPGFGTLQALLALAGAVRQFAVESGQAFVPVAVQGHGQGFGAFFLQAQLGRSEEHTSELQSRETLV